MTTVKVIPTTIAMPASIEAMILVPRPSEFNLESMT
jgi:hypothetical protein